MTRSLIPGIALAGALLVGCASELTVVTQAAPDPLVGHARFGVLPVDYTDARVDGKREDRYLDGKDDKDRARLADDKAALEDTFRRTLRATAGKQGIEIVADDGPGEAPYLIRPSVTVLRPEGPTRVEMNVTIVASDGEVVDEIQVSHGSDPQPAGPLRADGEALGTLVANYVSSRVGRIDRSALPEPPAERPTPAPPPIPPEPTPAPVAVAAPPPSPPLPSPPPPSPRTRTRAGRAAPGPARHHAGAPKPPPIAPPPGTPIANAPSFSRLEDGRSRIWIEVSQKVDVTETRTASRVSYRLRGAVVLDATDQLALPTEFFTTPVRQVQLTREGTDVDLVVDLRENVAPAYKVVDTPRGIALQIDFPRSSATAPVEAPAYIAPPIRRGRTPQTLGDGTGTPQQPPARPAGGRRGRGRPSTPSDD